MHTIEIQSDPGHCRAVSDMIGLLRIDPLLDRCLSIFLEQPLAVSFAAEQQPQLGGQRVLGLGFRPLIDELVDLWLFRFQPVRLFDIVERQDQVEAIGRR